MRNIARYSNLKALLERFEDRLRHAAFLEAGTLIGASSTSQRFASQIAKLYRDGVGRGF